ncbi:hypothetical protein N7454_002419 [Penicillium verhagenii]|nr:hypothetical protein N7454_002419 [Penicillium verhagenii]
MRAMLFVLWLSALNNNGAGVYAHSIKPLDQPIKAISSGEFGLPQGLHVHLHSKISAFGRDGEAIVRGTYKSPPSKQPGTAIKSDTNRRGILSWFVWAATKVFIAPMNWVTGLGIASEVTCHALGWWLDAPSWLQYACAAIGITTGALSVWDGRADLAAAWNDWREAASDALTSVELVPLFDYYGQVVANGGRRRDLPRAARGHETGYYDWSVLHPHLANRTVSNMLSGNRSIMHDVNRNYTIITMAHVINATDANPILVQRSINGTLLGAPVSMFYVNGTGSSAGLGAFNAFDKPATSRKRASDGDCDGYSDDLDVYADNVALCAGGGTETVDGGVTGVYYGLDFYGTEAQWKEYDADAGGQYPDSNGLWELSNDLTIKSEDESWWRACLCDEESGDYSWTGALQYTWNGGYNGYSDCYSATCGGYTA